MTRIDKILIAAGVLMASTGAAAVMIVMPQFRELLVGFGADLPWISKVLAFYSPVALVMPALVLAVAFAWPREKHRALLSVLLGGAFLMLSPALIAVAGYMPLWKLSATV